MSSLLKTFIQEVANRLGLRGSNDSGSDLSVCSVDDRGILRFRDGSTRVFRHRGSEADLGVMEQIFENADYDLRRLKRASELLKIHQDALKTGKTPMIIDAGANIGASTLWFHFTYPKSHIVCFEPDRENFQLLMSNTGGLDVELHQAAVGSVDGVADLVDPGIGEWGYRTMPNPNGKVDVLSLGRLIDQKIESGYEPFIAKIDIEGGEGELFSGNTGWMSKFPILIVELHDWLLPRQHTSAAFLKVISTLDRDFVYIGENIFSIKN